MSLVVAMKSRLSPCSMAAALVIASCASLNAAEKSSVFRYVKPIDNRPSTQEEILSFDLDSEIYAATHGFADLRIFNVAGRESPYEVERAMGAKTDRVRTEVASEVVSLREEGDSIEVHIRLKKDAKQADGLSFAIPQTDYERKVRVQGSEDGAKWTEAVSDGLLFDYSRYMDVRNGDVKLPPNKFRQLRVTIETVVQEKESPFLELTRTLKHGEETQRVERTTIERRPLRIDSIRLWRETTRELERIARTADYTVSRFQPRDDAEKKQTVLEVECRREPITSFSLRTDERNFARQVSVEIPVVEGSRTRWSEVGRATLIRFSFRSYHKEELTVQFAEQRESKYRVIIHNEDNPPLRIEGVRATGNVYRVVFLAEPDQTYKVYYDAENVESPRYEATTVLTALRRNFRPQAVRLGEQSDNLAFSGRSGGSLLDLLNRPWFLVVAVCAMVLVLGWVLFQAGMRMGAVGGRDATSDDVEVD